MSYQDLQALAMTGWLASTDQVWSPGFATWVMAAEIPGLIPKQALVAPPPPAPARKADEVTLPPARGDADAARREPTTGPRLAHAHAAWPPPPPARGAPMPPARKLAAPSDPGALAAASRAALIAPDAKRAAAWPAAPPSQAPPPPTSDGARHDHA